MKIKPSWCPIAQTSSDHFPNPPWSSLTPQGRTGNLSKRINDAHRSITSQDCCRLHTAPLHQRQLSDPILAGTRQPPGLHQYVSPERDWQLYSRTGVHSTILNKSYPRCKVLVAGKEKKKIKKGKFKVLIIPIRKLSLTQRLDYSPFKYKRCRSEK